MTAAFNIALPLATPTRTPPAIMKWTMDASGQWVRIPFIRDSQGDRPALALTQKDSK
jgi:hypothetical protein